MKKDFNEVSKNSTKCWIYDNEYFDGDVKVINHCHVTENIEARHRDIVISKLN